MIPLRFPQLRSAPAPCLHRNARLVALVLAAICSGPLAAAPAGGEPAPFPIPPAFRVVGDQLHYEVQPGDTAWSIAGRWLDAPLRWVDIVRLNRLGNVRHLKPGSILAIRPEWLRPRPATASIDNAPEGLLLNDQPLAPDARATEGDVLETPSGSRAVLKLEDGTVIELSPESRVRFERLRAYFGDKAVEARIRLERGGIAPDSPPDREHPLEIRSPAGNALVRGTQFRVRSEPERSFIEVLRGDIAARSKGGNARVAGGRGSVVSPVKKPVVEALLPAPDLARSVPARTELPALEARFPAVRGATGYRVEVARDAGLRDVVAQAESARPDIRFTSPADGVFHIRVHAVAPSGLQGYGGQTQVVFAARPLPPLLLPADQPAQLTKQPAGVTPPAQVATAAPDTDEPVSLPDDALTLRWVPGKDTLAASRVVLQVALDRAFTRPLIEEVVPAAAGEAIVALPSMRAGARWWRAAIRLPEGKTGPFSAPLSLLGHPPAPIVAARPSPRPPPTTAPPVLDSYGNFQRLEQSFGAPPR